MPGKNSLFNAWLTALSLIKTVGRAVSAHRHAAQKSPGVCIFLWPSGSGQGAGVIAAGFDVAEVRRATLVFGIEQDAHGASAANNRLPVISIRTAMPSWSCRRGRSTDRADQGGADVAEPGRPDFGLVFFQQI